MTTAGWSTDFDWKKLKQYDNVEKIRRLLQNNSCEPGCSKCVWNNFGPKREEFGGLCGKYPVLKLLNEVIKNYKENIRED